MKLSESIIDIAANNFIVDNELHLDHNIIKAAIKFGAELVYAVKQEEFEEMMDEMYQSHLNEEAIKQGEK